MTVVEWGDRVSALLPADRLEVHLEPGAGDDDRSVSFDASGVSWAERRQALVDAVGGG